MFKYLALWDLHMSGYRQLVQALRVPPRALTAPVGPCSCHCKFLDFQLLLCPLLEQNPAVSRHLGYVQCKQPIYKQEAPTSPSMASLPRAATPRTQLSKTCDKERSCSSISPSSWSQTSSTASLHWEQENCRWCWKFTVPLTLSSIPRTGQMQLVSEVEQRQPQQTS